MDDVLLWESSNEKSVWQAIEFIDRYASQGLTFNILKFSLVCDDTSFAGFDVTPTNVRPCHQSLQAISEFLTPKKLTDVRSWFGLLNQVSHAFSMAAKMLPFRELLKPGTHMSGLQSWIRSFRNLKRPLSERLRKA